MPLPRSVRGVWGWTSVERLAKDMRHACRALGRDRLFTIVAILVLALGIGGNTTVFSLVNALLLNPFPYPHSDRLVEILSRSKGGQPYSTVPLPDFGFWREQSTSYEAMAAYGGHTSPLVGQSVPGFDGPERIVVGRATDSFLRVLGVRPALGRFFTADEDRPGGPPVVVLGYGAWLRRFGGNPDVLGQTVTLNGIVRTIVGVMPARLVLPGTTTREMWEPAAYDIAANMQPGYNTRYDGDSVIARLKPGVSRERAQTEMALIRRRVVEAHAGSHSAEWDNILVPLGSDIAQDEGTRLHMLALIVGTGLLLGCANLAGLLLARSGARSKEMAVRASLGAGRSRLIRFALTETVMLAVCGGALGLALARWSIAVIAAAAPPYMGLDSALRIDPTVMAFALGISLLTGLAFGIVPAMQGSRADITTVLKGTSSARSRRGGRILSALVIGEVALALLLLVGGALMARSFIGLTRVDTGVRPDGVLTFPISLSESKYEANATRTDFFNTLLDGLRRLPGVTSAGAVVSLPMSRQYSGGGFTIEGRPAPANWRDMSAQYCQATPQYFRAMGIPFVLGRDFLPSDGPAQLVVIINHALAKRYFPNENPLGQRITDFGTIVGVVGDVRHNGPSKEPGPQIYYPHTPRPARTLSFVVRTTGDPMKLVPLIRQAVRALDANLPVDRLQPMSSVIADSLADVRIITALIGGFAVFALVLAAIGMYGVIAYSVSQRQQEIGVRVALGATRRHILVLIVRRGVLLAAAGIVIGIPVVLATGRVIAAFLFGVSPHDRLVLIGVPLLLLAVALAASYLPARRATKIDPLAALRSE